MEFRKHRVGVLLSGLSVVAFIGAFAFSGERVAPILRGTVVEPMLLALGVPNSIAFNLCIGYLTSVFFWWLVVYLPEQKRRKLLRDSLARRYADFKRNTIQICVWAAGLSLSTNEIDMLTDPVVFKKYFDQKWNDVANGLQGNALRLEEIHAEMEMLAQEVSYILNNLVIQEDAVHGLLKRLNEQLFRLRHDSKHTDDSVKYICQFLWSVLANWSFVTGYTSDDPIEQRINTL